MEKPIVGIIMGSTSDLKVMHEAADFLEEMGIGYELTVVSAHRTPDRLMKYAGSAATRGLQVIIAGAGGAAHLPGMTASVTSLPVIGVPVRNQNSLDGMDSLLSIVQMPAGVPVATVAVDGAKNAAVLATQIIALNDPVVAEKFLHFRESQRDKVLEAAEALEKKGYRAFLQGRD
jgi:5-(carboxyamino)imidazole ribonucleotide mutase